MANSTIAWSTDNEKQWIDKIGNELVTKVTSNQKIEILKNYINASDKRVDWFPISKSECIRYAKIKLQLLTK